MEGLKSVCCCRMVGYPVLKLKLYLVKIGLKRTGSKYPNIFLQSNNHNLKIFRIFVIQNDLNTVKYYVS